VDETRVKRRHSLGLISDTHGFFHPELNEVFAGVDLILHAGDIGRQSVLDALSAIAPVAAVRGNIDGGLLRDLPLQRVVAMGDKRIALIHIAGSPKRPNRDVRRLIEQHRPDVLVVGHSHIAVVQRLGDTLWINPGAAGNQGLHIERTAALLHIEADGKLALDRVLLGPRGGRVS
jgi:putative phosphoesterase